MIPDIRSSWNEISFYRICSTRFISFVFSTMSLISCSSLCIKLHVNGTNTYAIYANIINREVQPVLELPRALMKFKFQNSFRLYDFLYFIILLWTLHHVSIVAWLCNASHIFPRWFKVHTRGSLVSELAGRQKYFETRANTFLILNSI